MEEEIRFYFNYAGDISGIDNLTLKQGLIRDESTFIHNTINNEVGNYFVVKIAAFNKDYERKIELLDELGCSIGNFMAENPNYELNMKVELGFKLKQ